MTTLMTGAALGAGAMYIMDPDRGDRRRAELRGALADMNESELMERARRLEPLTAVRQLGGEAVRQLGGEALRQLGGATGTVLASSRWAPGARRGWRRRRSSGPAAREWVLLGGIVGAIAAGLWLARRAMGSGEGIEIVRTVTVDAPVERAYEFWNDFENFPRFMSHVREVRRTGADRTHWVVAGPGGTPIEWDAVVTRRVPNQEIGWRTDEASLVDHEGTVRFSPADNHRTRIEVRLTYRPVGGAVGHGVATLFGNDPDRAIAEDLGRVASQLRGARPAVGESGQRW
jgi:uncharacterized membrane protein